MKGINMRALKDLINEHETVWIYCDTEELQSSFLDQAEDEGFLALNDQKPTALFHHKLYGISNDMTMGYLSSMIWSLTIQENDNHTRIDYGRFISGNEVFIYGKQ